MFLHDLSHFSVRTLFSGIPSVPVRAKLVYVAPEAVGVGSIASNLNKLDDPIGHNFEYFFERVA